jgi:chromosome segregation ATPase
VQHDNDSNPVLPCGCAPCEGCRDWVRQLDDEVAALRAKVKELLNERTHIEARLDRIDAENDALRADLATANTRIVDEFNRRVVVEADRDRWRHDHDSRVGSWDRALAMAERAEAEVERMRPVVEAACEQVDLYASDTSAPLIGAVETYREATTDGS